MVTAKLICVFVFAYTKCWFSHAQAHIVSYEPHHEKTRFGMYENKDANQRLCFHYIDCTILYFQNPKFQASSHLLWLYNSLFCVKPGRQPRKQGFSSRSSNDNTVNGKPVDPDQTSPCCLTWVFTICQGLCKYFSN